MLYDREISLRFNDYKIVYGCEFCELGSHVLLEGVKYAYDC